MGIDSWLDTVTVPSRLTAHARALVVEEERELALGWQRSPRQPLENALFGHVPPRRSNHRCTLTPAAAEQPFHGLEMVTSGESTARAPSTLERVVDRGPRHEVRHAVCDHDQSREVVPDCSAPTARMSAPMRSRLGADGCDQPRLEAAAIESADPILPVAWMPRHHGRRGPESCAGRIPRGSTRWLRRSRGTQRIPKPSHPVEARIVQRDDGSERSDDGSALLLSVEIVATSNGAYIAAGVDCEIDAGPPPPGWYELAWLRRPRPAPCWAGRIGRG
jgi:hypothetical protein